MLYDTEGRAIHCGNYLWGTFVPPVEGEQDPFGRTPVTPPSVICQLNPKRGDFGFPRMEYQDHCSHHTALIGLDTDGIAKPLPSPDHVPESDWLLGRCFACGAQPGEICSRPAEIRERTRHGIHLSREASAGRAIILARLPGCPFCRAEPGKPCVIPGDQDRKLVHHARERGGYFSTGG